MAKKVLFSIAGKTDPYNLGAMNAYLTNVKNAYVSTRSPKNIPPSEGPLLCIMRKERPDVVYLFLTTAMEKTNKSVDENAEGIYVQAFKKQCTLIDLESKLTLVKQSDYKELEGKSPADYNAFFKPFEKIIAQIFENDKPDELLFNISSGTSQLTLTLVLLAESKWNGRIHSVQVKAREREASGFDVYTNVVDNIGKLYENDNTRSTIDFEAFSRCEIVNLSSYFRINIVARMKSLIQNFDYEGALTIYNEHDGFFSKNLFDLLIMGAKRSKGEFDPRYDTDQQNKMCSFLLPNIFLHNQYYVIRKISGFLCHMNILTRKKEYSALVIKTAALIEYITDYIIEYLFRVKLSAYIGDQNSIYPERQIKLNADIKAKNDINEDYFAKKIRNDNTEEPLQKVEVNFKEKKQLIQFISAQSNLNRANIEVFRKIFALRYQLSRDRNGIAHEIETISLHGFILSTGYSDPSLFYDEVFGLIKSVLLMPYQANPLYDVLDKAIEFDRNFFEVLNEKIFENL